MAFQIGGEVFTENGWQPHPSLVQDSGDDQISRLANELNLKLDDATKDNLVQYYLQEKGAENAMARSREFNQQQYSDMVAGLKKAGLNPMLALQGLNGANMMQGQSVSTGYRTQKKAQEDASNKQTAASIIGGILMSIAIVIGAVVGA